MLDLSPKNFVFSKTFISDFSYIEIWLTDQNSKLLKLEDEIKITLVVNYNLTYKMTHYLFHYRDRISVKEYGIFVFC